MSWWGGLQQAVERIDAAYQPKLGEERKGRETIDAQGIFGHFPLSRDYYYHAGNKQGHDPADEALGLEVSDTPALNQLLCWAGADEATYLKAQRPLEQTGGIRVSACQIQRLVQRVGSAAQPGQERPAQPNQCQRCKAPVMYVSADGTGVPMVPEELEGRKGKQSDGKAKTRQAYLGALVPAGKIGSDTRQDDCLVTPAVVFPLGRFAFSLWCVGHVGGGLNFGGRSPPLGSGEGVVWSIAEARAHHSSQKPSICSFFRNERFIGRAGVRGGNSRKTCGFAVVAQSGQFDSQASRGSDWAKEWR